LRALQLLDPRDQSRDESDLAASRTPFREPNEQSDNHDKRDLVRLTVLRHFPSRISLEGAARGGATFSSNATDPQRSTGKS
jgi:hypothetical protein